MKRKKPLVTSDVTIKKRATFLGALAETGSVTKAAEAVGVSRVTCWRWREADQSFAAGWEVALDEYVDKMEREADRRAMEGVDHPVIHQGEITDTYKQYSDLLLMFRLKGLRPEKYRDNFEGSLSGAKIQVNILQFSGGNPNNSAAQFHAPQLPTPVSESDGRGDKTGGPGVAPQSWER